MLQIKLIHILQEYKMFLYNKQKVGCEGWFRQAMAIIKGVIFKKIMGKTQNNLGLKTGEDT